MKKIFLIIALISSVLIGRSQTVTYLVEPMIAADYNFQTKGFGPDIRGNIWLYKFISVAPRIAYYPSYNKIHELYAGVDLLGHKILQKKWDFYGFVGGFYNMWFNYSKFNKKSGKANNLEAEAGAGLVWRRGCINPFIEGRYNTKWKEGTLALGILINLNRCKNKYRAISCPNIKSIAPPVL